MLRFRNLGSDKRDYLRGFGYQGSASRQGWKRDVAEMGIVADLKDAISEPGPWQIGMTAFGEMLPEQILRPTDTSRASGFCSC